MEELLKQILENQKEILERLERIEKHHSAATKDVVDRIESKINMIIAEPDQSGKVH